MKRDKTFYWVATSVVAIIALMAGIMYFISPMVAERFKHLGFPDYFRIELAIAQLIGAFALILPMVLTELKNGRMQGLPSCLYLQPPHILLWMVWQKQ